MQLRRRQLMQIAQHGQAFRRGQIGDLPQRCSVARGGAHGSSLRVRRCAACLFCSDGCMRAIVCVCLRLYAFAGSARRAQAGRGLNRTRVRIIVRARWRIRNRKCMIGRRAVLRPRRPCISSSERPDQHGSMQSGVAAGCSHLHQCSVFFGESSMEPSEAPIRLREFNKMLEQFKLPGFDVPAVMEARRKDVEALVTANQTAHARHAVACARSRPRCCARR